MLTITDSALESEPNLLNKKFDYVKKVYTQGPRRNANQPTSGHLKTIRHPNAAKEMPIYPMQFEQCKRILRPNAAKESRLKNTCNAMVAPPEKCCKKGYAERMLRPSLNAGKMAGWYSESLKKKGSLAGKCWKSGLASHAVYGNWMEERISGWPAVGGEKERGRI